MPSKSCNEPKCARNKEKCSEEVCRWVVATAKYPSKASNFRKMNDHGSECRPNGERTPTRVTCGLEEKSYTCHLWTGEVLRVSPADFEKLSMNGAASGTGNVFIYDHAYKFLQ